MDEHAPVEAELPPLDPLPIFTTQSILESELQSINQSINSLTAPWQQRIQYINRLSDVSVNQSAQNLPGFVQSISQISLIVQLSDRRSAVVKAACASIINISKSIKQVVNQSVNQSISQSVNQSNNQATTQPTVQSLVQKINQSTNPPNSQSKNQKTNQSINQSNNQKIAWMNLVCQWFDALTPNACVTIKVISDASINALHYVIDDIAGLDLVTEQSIDQSINQSKSQDIQSSNDQSIKVQGGEPEYALLYRLIDGCSHKHAAIRNESFKGLATLINRLIDSLIERERENDHSESQQIKQSLIDYKNHLSTNTSLSMKSINQSEPSSPLPFNPSINPSINQSILFAKLEAALFKGANDSDPSTRQSARKALLAFQNLSPNRGDRLIMALPIASQKSLAKDRLDGLIDSLDNGEIVPAKKQSIRSSIRKGAPKMASLKDRAANQSINQSPKLSPKSSPKSSPKRRSINRSITSPMKAEITYSMGSLITPPEDLSSLSIDESANQSDTESTPEPSSNQSVEHKPAEESINQSISQSINPRHYTVLSKLLDLVEPVLTEKTLDFLTQAPVIEAFIRFVTQTPSANLPEPVNLRINHLTNQSTSQLDDTVKQSIKQSYNVYRLICHSSPTPALQHLVITHMQLMWKLLCASFVPINQPVNQSIGQSGFSNLFHVCGILTHFFTRMPYTCLDLLLADQSTDESTNQSTNQSVFHYFLNAFDVLHESPVNQLLLLILSGPAEPPVMTHDGEKRMREKRMKLISKIRSHHVLNRIMNTVMILPTDNQSISQSTDQSINQSIDAVNQSKSEASVDFLCQLLSAVSRCELLTSFFAHISNDDGLIVQALKVVTARKSINQSVDQSINQSINQSTDPASMVLPINQPIKQPINQPFVYTSRQRQSCSSLLLALVESVSTKELFLPISSRSTNQSINQPTNETAITGTKKVPNPLFALKQKVVTRLKSHVCDLSRTLHDCEDGTRLGLLRFKLFELIVRLIDLDPVCVFEIPRHVWLKLIDWTINQFAHQVFLQQCIGTMLDVLVRYPTLNQSVVLFSHYEEAWKWLFQEEKLLSQLCSAFHCHESALVSLTINQSRCLTARPLDSMILRFFACLRLSSCLLPRSCFFMSHLVSHSGYRTLLSEITRESMLQATAKGQPQHEAQYLAYMAARTGQAKQPLNANFIPGIEIGSTFAQKLGYVGNLTVLQPPLTDTSINQSNEQKKKKKNRKKKKKTNVEMDENEDEEEENEDKGKQEEQKVEDLSDTKI